MRTVHRAALAAICLAAVGMFSACDPGGFRVLDSGTSFDLRGLDVLSEFRFVVAGEAGTVLEVDKEIVTDTSTDADPGPRRPNFYAVIAGGGPTYIAGDDGLLLARDGRVWTREDSRTTDRLFTLFRATPTRVYAAGDNGRVITKASGEPRWSRVDVGAPAGTKFTGVWAISAQSIVFATDGSGIVERAEDRWNKELVAETATAAVPLFDVWSSTAGADLVAVGLGGAVYRRSAADGEWTREETPVTQDLYAIWGNAPDRIFAVGARGTILRYDGAAWKGVPAGTSNDLFAVDGTADGASVVIAGARGTILSLEE